MLRIGTIATVLLFAIICTSAKAQSLIGAKVGASGVTARFSYPSPIVKIETGWLVKFQAGLVSRFELGDRTFVQPELLYAVKGWAFRSFEGQESIHYLNIPVLAGIRILPRVSLITGPEIGFSVRTEPFDGVYKKFDFGWAGGFNVDITRQIAVDLRYVHGITKLEKIEFRDQNNNPLGTHETGSNRAIQMSLLYLIPVGKQPPPVPAK